MLLIFAMALLAFLAGLLLASKARGEEGDDDDDRQSHAHIHDRCEEATEVSCCKLRNKEGACVASGKRSYWTCFCACGHPSAQGTRCQ